MCGWMWGEAEQAHTLDHISFWTCSWTREIVGCSHHGHWETWQKRQMCVEGAAFLETEPADEKRAQRARRKPGRGKLRGPKEAGWRCSWGLFPSCSDTGTQRHTNNGWALRQGPSLTVHLNLVLDLQGWWYLNSMWSLFLLWNCEMKFTSRSDVNSFEVLVAVFQSFSSNDLPAKGNLHIFSLSNTLVKSLQFMEFRRRQQAPMSLSELPAVHWS